MRAHGSSPIGRSDAQLQWDVLVAVRREAGIRRDQIDIRVSGGVLTLSGEVDSVAQRHAIVDAARRVDEMLTIAEDLRVVLTAETLRTDDEIRFAAEDALAWGEMPHPNIRPYVQDGWLWLIGDVAQDQERAAAERAVLPLVGIKGVTNLVRVRVPAAG
ncbi:MAG TPA: BON domain-containing protein [Gemmatimonadaceae bacterium]|nr:BON domain-containing protein [Gemmatimonadaceae bacterium]